MVCPSFPLLESTPDGVLTVQTCDDATLLLLPGGAAGAGAPASAAGQRGWRTLGRKVVEIKTLRAPKDVRALNKSTLGDRRVELQAVLHMLVTVVWSCRPCCTCW